MDNPIRLHWLDPRNPHQPFPAAQLAMRDPNGLLAIGGDLSVTRLLHAYAQGIFPWYNPDEPILWWCPDPRAVLIPSQFHVSSSLARRLRKCDYAVSLNAAFGAVLEHCAAPRTRGAGARPSGSAHGTWLGPEMKLAYQELHERGHAQSLEVWQHGALVGGIYGVSLGRVFFGESMFTRETDASKVALARLVAECLRHEVPLIDCQMPSPHLTSLGSRNLPRPEFEAWLARLVDADVPMWRG